MCSILTAALKISLWSSMAATDHQKIMTTSAVQRTHVVKVHIQPDMFHWTHRAKFLDNTHNKNELIKLLLYLQNSSYNCRADYVWQWCWHSNCQKRHWLLLHMALLNWVILVSFLLFHWVWAKESGVIQKGNYLHWWDFLMGHYILHAFSGACRRWRCQCITTLTVTIHSSLTH